MQLKARKTLPLGVNLKMEKLGQHDILLNGTGDKGQIAGRVSRSPGLPFEVHPLFRSREGKGG